MRRGESMQSRWALILAGAGLLALGVAGAAAQSDDGELRQTEHLRIENPEQLDGVKAEKIYQSIADELVTFYAMSREPTAGAYRNWRRYNSAPYLSATHGNRYVNNYANAKGAGYESLKSGVKMPVGAIFAKDSFTVTAEGEVFGAALFMMEKLAPGTSPKTAEWRYVEILPDGSYSGDTTGDNAADMDYCHACHKIKAKVDYLYYVPRKYRR